MMKVVPKVCITTASHPGFLGFEQLLQIVIHPMAGRFGGGAMDMRNSDPPLNPMGMYQYTVWKDVHSHEEMHQFRRVQYPGGFLSSWKPYPPMSNLHDIIHTFIGLLAIVNPLVAVPMFISLTSTSNEAEKRKTARLSALTVGIVLTLAAVAGQALLQVFGISIAAFRVAGGILILLMAIAMLHAKAAGGNARHTEAEANEAANKEQVGVVPLGIPLLAGPGAISTVIIYAHQNPQWSWIGILVGLVAVLALLVWIVLYLAEYLATWLGATGLNIANRIMGLLLAAIAVGFITEGLKVLLPGLG
ncbi:multiple antibiotic resistance (MarC)-related protein [Thiothrix nivea DSM 5205]|uniref:UPF0056 membrane protein n=2 Tax=Thiothrix nivea TaxID=1031 RepID=A0A656HKX2_THINJ|nr:multiple antibiotic resistance (MarC)-related protein [Thiothrix nivea DSM 5205]